MAPMPSAIASRTLVAIDAAGREFALTIGIGAPYQISEREWACPLSMAGLYERLHDAHGVDSWQALQLAVRLIDDLLAHFIEQGGRLYLPEGREPVSLEELFPRF